MTHVMTHVMTQNVTPYVNEVVPIIQINCTIEMVPYKGKWPAFGGFALGRMSFVRL